MNTCRGFAEALKRDFKGAPETPDGPYSADALGASLDKSREWVYAVMRGEIPVTVRDCLAWERETGGRDGLHWINEQLGMLAFPKPSGNVTREDLPHLFSSAGDLAHRLADIYKDGRVDEHEAGRQEEIAGLADELVRVVWALRETYLHDAEAVKRGPRTMAEAEAQGGKQPVRKSGRGMVKQ